jgi:hypothetical protein
MTEANLTITNAEEEKTAIDRTDSSPESLLKLAIEKGADLDKLERLIELKERWEKQEAEKAFNLAMANFQKQCPIVKKSDIVKDKNGKERYRFANIGDIINQVGKIISDNELFYDFKTEEVDGFMKVICTVTHSKGHSKATDFKVPIGKEEYMTDVQKYGARLTFAKRYSFCNVFGITTADEDNDAQTTGRADAPTNGKIPPNENAVKTSKEVVNQKPAINDVQYEKAKERIAAGENIINQLLQNFTLTKEQNDELATLWANRKPNTSDPQFTDAIKKELEKQDALSGLNAVYFQYKDLHTNEQFNQCYNACKVKLAKPEQKLPSTKPWQ